MNVIIWIAQALVGLAFTGAGIGKLTQPKDKLKEQMAFVEDFTQGQVRLIGTAELLGALGVILPSVTKILPWLTPVAAGGLVLLMLGAMATHYRRGEMNMIPVNLVLGGLALFVLIGRASLEPISS